MSSKYAESDCVCQHGWDKHFVNGKLGVCTFNQAVCDCWEYNAQKIERREIFDLRPKNGRDQMTRRKYVKMDPIEKAQIVARVEAQLGYVIIDPKRMACLEGCRCSACFQKYLDTSVANSELAIQEAVA